MSKPIPRQHEVKTDEIRTAIARYRQLREWKKQADDEMKQLQEKLGTILAEHQVDQLTVDGVTSVSIREYDRETVSAKELKEQHPRIYAKIVKLTHVASVVIK